MKIKEICGGSIALKLEKELEIDRVLAIFENYEIVFKSKDSAKVKKNGKEAMIFSYGEIVFTNFTKEEIMKIAKKL
ncbi:MAG: hypothetical protein QXQ14_02800 [Candidatus Aenigmatarchaeota archaeon]